MKREHKFTMMFSEDEFTKLRELAQRRGLSLSTFLRLPLYEPSSSTMDESRTRVSEVRRSRR